MVAYYAPQFEEMRRRCCSGGTAAYLASLSRSRKWDSRGGKSGSYFAKTHDDRYIIKQMSKTEKASFLDAAPAYFRYVMGESRKGGQGTCLSKIVGIYQVSTHPTSHDKNKRPAALSVFLGSAAMTSHCRCAQASHLSSTLQSVCQFALVASHIVQEPQAHFKVISHIHGAPPTNSDMLSNFPSNMRANSAARVQLMQQALGMARVAAPDHASPLEMMPHTRMAGSNPSRPFT